MRVDKGEYPGVRVMRGEDGTFEVRNDSQRTFVFSGDAMTTIPPGGVYTGLQVTGEKFSLSWQGDLDVPPRTQTVEAQPEKVADANPGEQPPASTPANVPTALLGSSKQPATYPEIWVGIDESEKPLRDRVRMSDEVPNPSYRDLQLGDVVAYTVWVLGMTTESWNAQTQERREDELEVSVQELGVAASKNSTAAAIAAKELAGPTPTRPPAPAPAAGETTQPEQPQGKAS